MNNSYFLPSNIPRRYERSDVVFSVGLQITPSSHEGHEELQERSGSVCRQRAFLTVLSAANGPSSNMCAGAWPQRVTRIFLQNQPEKPHWITKRFRTWETWGKHQCRERQNSLSLASKHKAFEAWHCPGGIFHKEHQRLHRSAAGRVNSFLIIKGKESTHVQPAEHAVGCTLSHTLPLRVSGWKTLFAVLHCSQSWVEEPETHLFTPSHFSWLTCRFYGGDHEKPR